MLRNFLFYLIVFLSSSLFSQNQWIEIYYPQYRDTTGKLVPDPAVLKVKYEAIIQDDDTLFNGKYSSYFETTNGPKRTGTYLKGLKNGQFIDNYENGQTKWVRNYKQDILTGKEEFYFNNGELKWFGENTIISKKDPIKIAFTHYHPDSSVSQKGYLINDKLEGTIQEFYSNGNLKSEMHFKEGKRNGLTKTYYQDGSLLQKVYYKNDILTDSMYSYYPDGNLKEKGYFIHGLPNGIISSYYEDGVLKQEVSFKNDTIDGAYKTYFHNGNVKSLAIYHDGVLNGDLVTYYENGQQDTYTTFSHGIRNGIYEKYSPAGKIIAKGQYLNGQLDGLSKNWYEDGTLKHEANYQNGQLHGKETFYYANGKTKAVYHFINGKKSGQWEEYYEDGTLKLKASYDPEKNTGSATLYYPSGNLKSEEQYVNEKKAGKWTTYYDQSKKVKHEEIPYERGKIHGQYLSYHPNKKIQSKINYTYGLKDNIANYYNEEGKLIETYSYRRDIAEGQYQKFNDKGEKVLSGLYKHGKRNGEWTSYENGKPIKITQYRAGKIIKEKNL